MKLNSAVLCLGAFLVFAISAQSFNPSPEKSARPSHNNPDDRITVQYLNPQGGSSRPFSEAVRAGDWLILSGKLGTDSAGKLVTGGVKAETKQTLDNIRGALERYGSSLDDVVKCTVMLADMKEWGDMNEVYTTYFKRDRMPARSALGVNGLALNARVEIECWAVNAK